MAVPKRLSSGIRHHIIWYIVTDISKGGTAFPLFYPEDGGSTFLSNVNNNLSHKMT
jgi:hypothetical protein